MSLSSVSSAEPLLHSYLLKMTTTRPPSLSKLLACFCQRWPHFNPARSGTIIKLFDNFDVTSCFEALLSCGSAQSALSFKIWFAPEDFHKLPDLAVIALIHSTTAFRPCSEGNNHIEFNTDF
jgi:hypothetical protein